MEPGTVVWRETAQSLLRQKWLIIGCILLGLFGAAVYALVQTERWTASSQLVIGPAVPPALVGKLDTSSDKTGPLGMDLPAETQARVMASPTLLREVAKSLGMPTNDDTVQKLAAVTRVKAVTDNAYLVTTDGPTASEAVRRANAIATIYLDQRNDEAKGLLTTLAGQAQDRSKTATQQSRSLISQINEAVDRGDSQTAAALRDQRVGLATEARQAADDAAAMRKALTAVGAGSELVTPATTDTASSSPMVARDILVGGILGLVLGFGLALLRSHLTPYILTRDQAARAASSPVITASEGNRRRFWHRTAPELPQYEITSLGTEASGALARRELNPRAFGSGAPGTLLVVSASPTPNSAGIALAMAEANARDGRETLLILADVEGTPVLPHVTGHEGLTDLVNEPAATRAIRARKLFRPGTVADLYVLPPGLNHEETATAVGPSLVPGIVADLPPGYSVVIHGPGAVGRMGITPLAAAVDASVLVVQVGHDKEMDVARLTAALQYAGAPVVGVVLIGASPQDETLGIPLNFKAAESAAPPIR
ncbi:LPS O-antigen subunit length determinant protein (WzzB/FepE family) [Kribbella antiqua]|uniref:LPS O-antigen subunit length determinant protein (WzzB/FepE family) n=1 Tax=Kribbella antiqua TaxID=2512217 RepID=A0A4R2J615_9ACTN|nr:Wzz/FepE/Etk N-terminal domain-containing protein [Kribbella antiqua]TCO52056.1 LPS O-antigen subunit length determinant protein (WzzB/FepE family) [Kribbella antiqua]